MVQAADLVQSRRLIPDLATWTQCFGIYTAAVARKQPGRVPDLMAYLATISKTSQKYRWPSWVIYDQNFRIEVAGNPTLSWAKVDPSLYAQCFTGQARSTENWCSHCQALDHSPIQASTPEEAMGSGIWPNKHETASSREQLISVLEVQLLQWQLPLREAVQVLPRVQRVWRATPSPEMQGRRGKQG